MNDRLTRRKFVAAAGLGALARPSLLALAQAPEVLTKRTVKPVVVSAANGNKSKDAQGLTCVARAFRMIAEGADVLAAVVAGVNILELDPEDTSVGYGGLPNAEGVVQLDASVMHGPLKRAGAVACLEGVRTPSLVAKKVMEETDHHLLVGRDARQFARNLGFKVEEDLLTEKSRALWLEWKRRADHSPFLNPKERAEMWRRAGESMLAEGLIDAEHFHGTVNCIGLNAKGAVAGVTSTSGLVWKVPGRVGDSPILGAGLYVDGAVGAAGSTGRGEANLYNLCSFLIVENLRRGMPPKDAGMDALKRIRANTVEKRLLNDRGNPRFQLLFYVLNRAGEHAGLALYGKMGKREARYAFCDENGPQTLPCESLIAEGPPE